jgi:hypothetical protein
MTLCEYCAENLGYCLVGRRECGLFEGHLQARSVLQQEVKIIFQSLAKRLSLRRRLETPTAPLLEPSSVPCDEMSDPSEEKG